MKKARIGIIGAGGIAQSVHLPSLSELENCEIAAICDLDAAKANAMAQKYHIPKVYGYHMEMLRAEKLDGVFALVEPDRMYRVAHDCIELKLPTMMEKPAGINAYQADSLARQAAESGVPVACALNRRAIPLVQFVFERMKELTPITQVNGCFIKNNDIASCWHYMSAFVSDIVHAVDLVRYFSGSEPAKAATVIARNNCAVDNAWSSVMQFENGVVGMLQSNYQTGGRVHNFEIHGPKASAFINLGFGDAACDAKILHFGGKTIYSMAAAGVGEQQIEFIDGKQLAKTEDYHAYYGYKQEDERFINFLLGSGEPFFCDIADAAKSMEMAEMLLESRI